MLFVLATCLSTSALVAAQTSTRTISFASSAPTSAVTVPKDFVGFGFDTITLNSYDNEFSTNLINSVASRMSVRPIIRIGGTSGDYLKINPGQTQNVTCDDKSGCFVAPGGHYTLGPGYFKGFTGFSNNRMSFQAPLGPSVNKTNIVQYVTRAYENLGASRLAAIAIGNEVGGYENTAQDYVTAADKVQSIVTSALNLSSSSQIFEVLDLSSANMQSLKPFTLQDAFNDGLAKNINIKYAAEHWYQTNSGTVNLQADLMNHGAIVSMFTHYGQSLSYLKSNNGPPLALTETGSTLGGTPVSVVDYFGAALWSVDFQLYSMSQGIARVDGTQRPTASHSLWVPVSGEPDMPGPSVRGPFYAQPYIADFVGSASAATQVVNMDLDTDYLTAYAAYEGGSLVRVALVNLNVWSSSGNSTARTSQPFAVSVPAGVTSVKVGALHAAEGTSAAGYDLGGSAGVITWSGQQWSYATNGNASPSSPTTTAVQVTNGVAMVSVPESEAVIVYI